MNQQEIKKLKDRIDARAAKFLENIDPSSEKDPQNDALASIAGTKGWEILKASLENMIYDMLQPEEFESAALDPVIYTILGESNRLAIHAIQTIIDSVEGANTAKTAENVAKREEEAEGVSE